MGSAAPVRDRARTVRAAVNYSAAVDFRPRFHANDKSRDVLRLEAVEVEIVDGRSLEVAPSLAAEGLKLVHAPSAVTDFRDAGNGYRREIEQLVARETGAERVLVRGSGVLRFAERSPDSGAHHNSYPARFIHNDVTEATAVAMAEAAAAEAGHRLADFATFALYNVWRPITPPPQDVPLAMLDLRTLEPGHLVEADAVFDQAGKPDWSFGAYLLRPDPRHRWIYFSDMGPDDALMFTTFAYRDGKPAFVPHTGFDDPSCPADAPPRASIEMRVVALFR